MLNTILPELAPGQCYFGFGLIDGKPCQAPCYSRAELEQYGQRVVAAGGNAYFSLAAFHSSEGSRKAANAANLQAIWADIDVGKAGSPYLTQADALQALSAFITSTKIAPTYIVSSGKGYHVYWAFTKPVPAEAWVKLSRLFAQTCAEHKLAIDLARVGDLTSVPRLPGSIHVKSGQRVEVVCQGNKAYSAKKFLELILVCTRNVEAALSPAKPVNADVPATPPTAAAQPIIENCAQIRNLGNAPYPAWFAGMSVLKRCVNGREIAHTLSAQDVRYDASLCDEKFDEASPDAPARCDTFEFYNPSGCEGCRYKGMVTSPVELSRVCPCSVETPVEADAPTDADVDMLVIPDEWKHSRKALVHPTLSVDDRGIIYREVAPDANGVFQTTEHIVSVSQLYYKYSAVDRRDPQRPQRRHVFEVVQPNGYTEEVAYIIAEDAGPQNTMKWFYNANIFPTSAKFGQGVFVQLINAYLASVLNKNDELATHDKFGWCDVTSADGEVSKGFVIGSGIVTGNGLVEVQHGGLSKSFAAREFSCKGTLEKWKVVPKLYSALQQHIGQLAMCMSFAAPLMKYGSGEAKNAILNIWSANSGVGKSQILRAAASVWGDPEYAFFSRDESVVARCRRLSVWNNMPACMDEITDMSDEMMYSLAYTLIGGIEKGKLRSSGAEFVSTGDWSTVVLATANRSFRSAIHRKAGDSDATLLRVMDYECKFQSYEAFPEVQKIIEGCMNACRQNYGLAGPEFLYQLLKRPERLATLTQQIEHWAIENGFTNNERFMSYSLALALQAGRWAKEFGLLDFDMDELERWVIARFITQQRSSIKIYTTDMFDMLTDYLSERLLNTLLVTNHVRDPDEPDPRNAHAPDKYIIYRPARELLIRHEKNPGNIYISRKDFDSWCKKHNHTPSVVLDKLTEAGVNLVYAQKNLSGSVSWLPPTRVRCYCLNSQDLRKLGYEFPAGMTTDCHEVECIGG